MEKHEVECKSSRTVPVVIENHENAVKKTKLMVPSHFTAAQLVNILRSRMHLLPYHPVYLFLKSKQRPVLMSKSIGLLHRKHRDEKGLLRLIHAGQASFGFLGNIRAIKFQQKWFEHLAITGHLEPMLPSYFSSGPPPHFPSESPLAASFGLPLDIDDTNDSLQLLNLFGDMPQYSEWAPSALENELSELSPDETDSANLYADLQPIDWLEPWLSSTMANPWLNAASTSQGHASGTTHTFHFSDAVDEFQNISTNLEHALENLHGDVSSSNTASSAIAPPPNDSNPQAPASNDHNTLYESDSDFYDSETELV